MRCLYPRVTRATMHRAAGVLAMLSGRVNGRVFVSVLAYDPARPGSNQQLQEAIFSTLADFALTATMQWDSQLDEHNAQNRVIAHFATSAHKRAFSGARSNFESEHHRNHCESG